jgi:hypothetical protein
VITPPIIAHVISNNYALVHHAPFTVGRPPASACHKGLIGGDIIHDDFAQQTGLQL